MKRKILIVEDNVGLSQMQKDWLAQAGYDAVTAMNEPIARSLCSIYTFPKQLHVSWKAHQAFIAAGICIDSIKAVSYTHLRTAIVLRSIMNG